MSACAYTQQAEFADAPMKKPTLTDRLFRSRGDWPDFYTQVPALHGGLPAQAATAHSSHRRNHAADGRIYYVIGHPAETGPSVGESLNTVALSRGVHPQSQPLTMS